jgi:hypothetical protein
MIMQQAVNSHMHKLGWGHGYHLADSNEMHPNCRKWKCKGKSMFHN